MGKMELFQSTIVSSLWICSSLRKLLVELAYNWKIKRDLAVS